MIESQLQDDVDAATVQLLIDLSFLLPRGTNLNTHTITTRLERYKRAIEARARGTKNTIEASAQASVQAEQAAPPADSGANGQRASQAASGDAQRAQTPEPTRCTLCRADYPTTGQHVGPAWLQWGPGYRICKRCYNAGRDARRDAKQWE